MYCKYCGALLADDSVFCSKCGQAVQSQNDNEVDSNKEWCYRDDLHETNNPISTDQMIKLIKERRLDFEDGEVKESGSKYWTLLKNSVFNSFIQNLPARKVYVPDICVWLLAILPTALIILMRIVNITMPIDEWIVIVVLNTVLGAIDIRIIQQKADIYEKWSFWGVILIPLYIVIREVKTNHNYSPAIINAFLFAVMLFGM